MAKSGHKDFGIEKSGGLKIRSSFRISAALGCLNHVGPENEQFCVTTCGAVQALRANRKWHFKLRKVFLSRYVSGSLLAWAFVRSAANAA